jgi:hypothetical protein
MKRVLLTVLASCVALTLASCAIGPEAKGDGAYNKSKRTQGDQQITCQKEAYMMYKRAIAEKGDKMGPRLRSRFCEMNLVRGSRILNNGAYNIDAVPLFVEDMDAYWSESLPDSVKNGYAAFLVRLGDSCLVHGKLLDAIGRLGQAVSVAGDKAFFTKAKTERLQSQVEQNLAVAKAEFQQGVDNKDAESFIRAEFWAQFVLEIDSSNAEARQLLGKAREQNVNAYSAYKMAVESMPADTAIFNRINKQKILFAVPVQSDKGSTLNLQVSMFNYSNNPQRLKAESFSLVDADGKKYVALPSSTIKPEILDQSFETTSLRLVFPRPAARTRKLVYESEQAGQRYYGEKYFY